MANRKQIKLVSFKRKANSGLSLELMLGSERATWDVTVVDRNGVFGLEMPDSLGMKLRNFPPEESRNLIKIVKREILGKLQAA